MGHVFFDYFVGSRTCEGASCSQSVVKHWGVNEGIAMIFEEELGGGNVGEPAADTTEEILEECNITAIPKGGQNCAHALGKLVVKAFGDVAESQGEAKALSIFIQAAKDISKGSTVTLSSFMRQVGQEIIDRADHQIPDPPNMSIYFDDSYRQQGLEDFLEWLSDQLLHDRDERPHFIPR